MLKQCLERADLQWAAVAAAGENDCAHDVEG